MNSRWAAELGERVCAFALVFLLGGGVALGSPKVTTKAQAGASGGAQQPKVPMAPVNVPPSQQTIPTVAAPPLPPVMTMMGPMTGTKEACEGLRSLKIEDTAIEAAGVVDTPRFNVPNSTAVYRNLPRFCRVVGVTRPAIRFEVWLPMEHWSGRYEVVGNGGMAGVVNYSSLAGGLRRGNATASTNTGHANLPGEGFDASWSMDKPELVEDFGHRALHLTTVNGKRLTREFYGRPAKHSIYVGCSKGGGQGLMEAERYPNDFDGIVAGDPAYNWTHLYAGAHLYYSQAVLKDPESYIQPAKVKILADAVNRACDGKDGFADGVVNDPFSCKVDLSQIACKEGEDVGGCFTPKQIEVVKKIWAGSKEENGKQFFPGLLPGGEGGANGWQAWVTGSAPYHGTHWRAADSFFRYMVMGDESYDALDFDYNREHDRKMLDRLAPMLNADDADLRPFMKRGGKLILYHGLSDPDISAVNTINFYQRVTEIVGPQTPGFARLFLAPGMQHCGGGPGPDAFDAVAAIQRWVDEGTAPEKIVASHYTEGVLDRSRPLCPYPQMAVYSGKGNAVEASSWVCKVSGGLAKK
ncbi:MAG: tannase/feruloyl esterase family alpha/beta hydrolase [Edaphobacter sp.]|uniref:tannase/feruloyl esterase family alpha/beta hydrolase n=1 Tax=Edaphobacter sp. TaxID=1934404 RepID=UPI0023A45B76|nr:tannase/feruloyl esterase family alpha/beta hydrolase [Edaphobacter sp.]MDE1175860.1 tannase/feruloyl esterase family alpha/beta hydrolase [Edaphobacter sp.]